MQEGKPLVVEARVKAHFPTHYIADDMGRYTQPTEVEQAAMKTPAEWKHFEETVEQRTQDTNEEWRHTNKAFETVVEKLASSSFDREGRRVEIERAAQARDITLTLTEDRQDKREAQRLHDNRIMEDAFKHRNDSEQAYRHFCAVSRKSQAAVVLDREHEVADRYAKLKQLATNSREKQQERIREGAAREAAAERKREEAERELEERKQLLEKAEAALRVSQEVNKIKATRQHERDTAEAMKLEALLRTQLQKMISNAQLEAERHCPRKMVLQATKTALAAQLELVSSELGALRTPTPEAEAPPQAEGPSSQQS